MRSVITVWVVVMVAAIDLDAGIGCRTTAFAGHPAAESGVDRSAGVDPDDGVGHRPDKAISPKVIPNPGSTAD